MASENINFDTIPASIRKPGKYFEFNTKLAVRTLPANKQRLLIIAGKLAAGTIQEKDPTQIFSDIQAAAMFGYGSQAHISAKAAITANPYVDLTICALDDNAAGVAATATITVVADATAADTLRVYIANQYIEIAIATADAKADIATAIAAAITAKTTLPVSATAAAAVVTITAKNKGLTGNNIALSYTVSNSAISLTITPMASGAGDPDIDGALAVVYAENYNIIVTTFNASESIVKLNTHLTAVSGAIEQRPAIGLYGQNGALAAVTTLANASNSGRILSAYLRSSKSLEYEIAAAFASVMALEEDPAMPLNTLKLAGINAPAITDRLSRIEQENLLYNGVSPLEVGPGENVQIVRAISTYIKDGQGVDDVSLLDITTIQTLDYVRFACKERISLRFPRAKLSSKTPARVRSELLDVLLKLEQLEIVEQVQFNADGLIVERDIQDTNRVNAKIPADVVNGLHIVAGRIDLLL